MNIVISQTHIKRLQKDWQKITKEPVQVEFIKGTFYGYCSELASLRLLKAYRNSPKADCGHSENKETH